MAVTTAGTALQLANTVLTVATPAITQEEKESLLDAYKARIAELQAVSDAVAKDPTSQVAGDAYGAFTGRMLNAGGLVAGGLAAITLRIPLDTADQLVTAAILLVLLNEQNAAGAK